MSNDLAIVQVEQSVNEVRKFITESRPIIQLYKDINSVVGEFNKKLNAGKPRQVAEAMEMLTNITQRYANVQRQLANANQRLSTTQQNAINVEYETARAREAAARASREESRARQQAAREAAAEARQNEQSTGAYKRFAREVLEAKNKAKNLGAEMHLLERQHRAGTISTRDFNRQMNDLSRQFVEASIKARGLHEQIRRIDASVGDNQRNVGNYKSALNGLSVTFRSLIAAFGVTTAIDMFANLIKSSFETIKTLNAQNVALNQIFETQTQVAFQQEYLRDITNRLGLELVSTTAAYTKYSASVKDTSLEGEKARHIFSAFAGASAKLGLNAETQTGIFRALEQMISKGTVQAEELRGQLGDRMPRAFKIFAQAAGVSTRELGEMMKKGEVLSADILPKVADELDKAYNLGNATKADTLVAAQNRFTNSWTNFLNQAAGNKELVNGLAAGMEGLGSVLNFLIDTLLVKGADGVSVTDDLVNVIKSLFDVLVSIAEAFGLVNEKTKNTIFSFNAFRNDLKNIQSIIAVITGAIRGLADTISAFFETMFQDDGWDKFIKRMDQADARFDKILNNAKKTEAEIKKANAEGRLYNDEPSEYVKAWTAARKAKQSYFQVTDKKGKSFYFSTETGKNTGKSLDDYIDDGAVLRKKVKSPIELGPEKKEKKPKAASLTAAQKDRLNDLQAERDYALAIITQQQNEGLISEQEYQEKRLGIIRKYSSDVMNYIKGKNAKERQVEAAVLKRASQEIKNSRKEEYDTLQKDADNNFRMTKNKLERQSVEIENSDYFTSSQRLTKRIEIDNQLLDQTEKYYNDLIATAKRLHLGDVELELERKKDEELGKIQDERLKKLSAIPDAVKSEIEKQAKIVDLEKEKTYEDQRRAILTDKTLSADERSYKLDLLEKQNQIEANDREIKKLETLKAQILAQKLLNKLFGVPIVLTDDEEEQLKEIDATIARLKGASAGLQKDIDQLNADKLKDKFQPIINVISSAFDSLGLGEITDEFQGLWDTLWNQQANWLDKAKKGFELLGAYAGTLVDKQKEKRIAALDEELKKSQENTDLELEFISTRLNALNQMDELSNEQLQQRSALEDKARGLREQQQMREKQIAIQKAKAEQKAAAQRALIEGLVGAAKSIPNWAQVAASIAAGGLMAALIMSKDPTPKYWKGREGGPAELAWTQERGREWIVGANGNIKSLGSDKGPELTWLEKGDKVITAGKTKSYMDRFKHINEIPKLGTNVFQKIAMQSLQAPTPTINVTVQKSENNHEKLIEGFGKKMESIMQRQSNPVIQKMNGFIIQFNGSQIPQTVGEYDLKTGAETWYQ